MIESKVMVLADNEVGSTGITQKTGIILVELELAATGVHRSAIFTLYDADGTPTTVLTAGSGTYFSLTVTTDTKVNVYWATDQIKVENKLGTTEIITVKFIG